MTDLSQHPGTLLREQRQLLGLTTADVAQQLNLKASVIEQLEQLTLDGSVAPTFLRGYLKLYARLLKLNEQQILQQFEPHLKALTVPVAMHSFSHKTRRDAAENRFMLASYFLIVLLIGLSVVWFWQTHLIDNEPVLSVNTVADANALTGRNQTFVMPSEPAAAAVPADSAGTAIESVAANEADAVVSVPADDVSQPAVVNAGTSALTVTPQSAVNESAMAVPTNASSVTTAPGAASAATAPTPAVASSPAIAETEALAAGQTGNVNVAAGSVDTSDNAGMVQLQFSFSAQCWLEVTGADGKRLAYQMAAAGQQLQLSGVAPVKVVLGNPAAVQLARNGQPVDLSAYQPGRAARLTLTGTN